MFQAVLMAAIVAAAFFLGEQVQSQPFQTGHSRPLASFTQSLGIVAFGLFIAAETRKSWVMAAIFLGAMAAAAFLTLRGLQIPEYPGLLALCIMVFGLMTALAPRPELWVSITLGVVFAVAHGHVVGLGGSSAPMYFGGFLTAAAGLIALGALLSFLADRLSSPKNARAVLGAMVGGMGLQLALLSYRVV